MISPYLGSISIGYRWDPTEATPQRRRDTYVPLTYAALSRLSQFAGNLQIRRFLYPLNLLQYLIPQGSIWIGAPGVGAPPPGGMKWGKIDVAWSSYDEKRRVENCGSYGRPWLEGGIRFRNFQWMLWDKGGNTHPTPHRIRWQVRYGAWIYPEASSAAACWVMVLTARIYRSAIVLYQRAAFAGDRGKR